jgi:hypothetical protein
MPETQNPISVDVIAPPTSSVPLRPGEEKNAGMLHLAQQLLKDGQIQALRRELAALEGVAGSEPMQKYMGGKNARRNRSLLVNKIRALKEGTRYHDGRWIGPCPPATVVNLNPIALCLMGELQRWTIPAAGKSSKQIKLGFNGRTFVASYMTITDPHTWLVPISAADDKTGNPSPTMDVDFIPPFGLAHQFYSHYVEGAADAQQIGGVLIFEGDIYAIAQRDERTPSRVERNGGRIWVPQGTPFVNEDIRAEYTAEEMVWTDYLERSLTLQRAYANAVIAEGHSLSASTNPEMRNQFRPSHHVLWHDWAVEVGYKESREKWATEPLKFHPSDEAVFCPDCHTRQDDPNQFFCANCNTPFDAKAAFLAGKHVSADRLSVYDLDSDDGKLILAEVKRRRANIALLELPEDATASKPAKGKTKKHDEEEKN